MVINAIIAEVPVTISGVNGAKVKVFTIAKEKINIGIGIAIDKVETGINVDAKEVKVVVDPDVEENVKLDKDIADFGEITSEEVTTPGVENNGTEDSKPEKPKESNLAVSGAAVKVNVENNTGSVTVAVTGSAIGLKLDPNAITGDTYNGKKGTFTLDSELPPLLNIGENSIMVSFKAEDETEVTSIMITLTINTNQTTGWFQEDGKWYYLDTNGDMVTGWKKIGDNWHYFDDKGVMATGWKQIRENWYYFDDKGVMATGWKQIRENWYYFDDKGAMVTGWKQIRENWYYFDDKGIMVTDTYIDGYYINSDGICLSK